MRWESEGPAWQYVMLDKMPPSIDRTLIEENLKRTPEARRTREDRAPKAR